MLRPIPEDESDHGVDPDVDSLDSMSAAAAVASTLGDGPEESARSIQSSCSAVIADAGEGLLKAKKKGKRRYRKRERHVVKKRQRWSSWKSFAVMTVVIAAAIAIVVIIIATASGNNDSLGPENRGDVTSPTSAPLETTSTHPPTVDPQISIELDALLDPLLVSLAGTDSDTAEILQSARASAREWMLTSDLLRDEVMAEPTQVRFKQRYALALMYYSMRFDPNMDKNGTSHDAVILSEESECKWPGIYCDEAVVEITATTTITVLVVRRVEWSGWQADGVLPPEIRWLKYMQELNVSCNNLGGTIPVQWFDRPSEAENSTNVQVELDHYLPYLYLLDASHNYINGDLPHELWLLPSLRFVYLTNNTLTGSLPSESLFEGDVKVPSPYLEDVWLNHNQLQGVLPNWLLNSPILKSLILEHNQFNGTQFDQLETVANSLLILDMSYNNFTGIVPAALFQAPSLAYLYLDRNQFSTLMYSYDLSEVKDSTIPLKDVWLYANQFKGEIPPLFGFPWPELNELLIHNNPRLYGTIVDGCSSGQWPKLQRMQADCLPLSTTEPAPITCECCTSCF